MINLYYSQLSLLKASSFSFFSLKSSLLLTRGIVEELSVEFSLISEVSLVLSDSDGLSGSSTIKSDLNSSIKDSAVILSIVDEALFNS